MNSMLAALPLLLLAVIVGLIVKSAVRGRFVRTRTPRPPRTPRAKKVTPLRVVSPDRMDAELQDLIRKR
jgi:hypothetical protein